MNEIVKCMNEVIFCFDYINMQDYDKLHYTKINASEVCPQNVIIVFLYEDYYASTLYNHFLTLFIFR